MSAPTVAIGRLSATLHDDGSASAGRAGLETPLRCVVEGGLERALREVRLPAGRWCVRRLRLTVPLDLDRPGPASGQDWSAAMAAAIERTIREGRGEIVHYRHDVELLADVVAGVASGRTGRLWAWQQAGALRPGDPAPTAEPRTAVLAALGRVPRHAAAALLRAAAVCGLPALDRVLGEEGWQAVAALTAVASWCGPGPAGPRGGTDADTAPVAPARALARTLLAGSALAGLARSARLRPGPATLAAWAVLVAAEADPGSLHRRPHPALPRVLAEELGAVLGSAAQPPVTDRTAEAPAPTAPSSGCANGERRPAADSTATGGEPAEGAPRPSGEGSQDQPGRADVTAEDPTAEAPSAGPAGDPRRHRAETRPSQPARTHRDDGPAPGTAPDGASGEFTGWAGLLFLLATAADAGLPQRALDDTALTARPLRWVLHRIGCELLPDAAPDDAALVALAGVGPAHAGALLAAPPPTAAELARVRALAAAWAAATAARLDPENGSADGRAAVRAIARRGGEVFAEPGWIEVRLGVAQTDLRVRRAGLDLDPGWVPWLGAVVRYVYA
ncbi:hypothetical protein ABZW30_18995 [Kitasatospora sp. NPDC004669]|uniref:hypothetical protein n=1 Tax=Kitasatospora sp. NPDC004669 TaxID=3154555 RepID=UPI0033AB1F3A